MVVLIWARSCNYGFGVFISLLGVVQIFILVDICLNGSSWLPKALNQYCSLLVSILSGLKCQLNQ